MSGLLNDDSPVGKVIQQVLIRSQEVAPGKWDEGDQMAFVLNDGVIVLSMKEGRDFNIKVIIGKPEFMDLSLNLLEEGL